MSTTVYMRHLVSKPETGRLTRGWVQGWAAQFDCSGWKRVGLHRSLKVRWKKLVCSESRWEFVCLPETLTIPLHSYVWKECITDLLLKKKKTSSKLIQFSQWFHYISGHSDLLGNLNPLSFIRWIDPFPILADTVLFEDLVSDSLSASPPLTCWYHCQAHLPKAVLPHTTCARSDGWSL